MFNLKLLLGLYPNTDKIEAIEKALVDEFNELNNFSQSADLVNFMKLKSTCESTEFIENKKSILSIQYKDSPEYTKEVEYLALKKNAGIINFYKVLESALYKNYLSLLDSKEIKEYEELEAIVGSDVFKDKKKNIFALKYNTTENFKTENEYALLKKKKSIVQYNKTINSALYSNFVNIKDHDEISEFTELEKIVASEEFKNKQLEIKSLAYKTSEEFKKETEYNTLNNSPAIKKYHSFINSSDHETIVKISNSDILQKFEKLKTIIESAEFKTAFEDKETFTSSEFEKKYNEYNELNNNSDLNNYFKVLKSNLYTNYYDVIQNGILTQLEELEKTIKSDEFIKAKEYLLLPYNEKWKLTEFYKESIRYAELKSNKGVNDYFTFIKSADYKNLNEVIESGDIEKIASLEKEINAEEFIAFKKYMLLSAQEKWKQTEEFVQEGRLNELNKLDTIKNYYKFLNSKEFKLFSETKESGQVEKYEELKAYIESEEFIKAKTYKVLPSTKKWEQTEEFQIENEFNTLQKSKIIKWYFEVYESPKFDELKKWNVSFSDEFDSGKLDTSKWLTRYYWGDTLLNDSYSLSDDKHFVTDGKNLRIEDSKLIIDTKKEDVTGTSWHPFFGFGPKEFNYTSGLINTGKSFRQKYGKFRAKIKVSDNSDITNAFWIVGEKILPQIDVFKCSGNLRIGNFWGNISDKDGIKKFTDKLFGFNAKGKFLIYEIEWNSQAIIWKINNIEIARQTEGIPDEEMYLSLSCGLYNETKSSDFPSSMSIDWVKAYQEISL